MEHFAQHAGQMKFSIVDGTEEISTLHSPQRPESGLRATAPYSIAVHETVQVNVNLPVTPLGRLAALKEEASTRLKTVVKQNPALYYFLQRIRSRSQGAPEPSED